MNVYKQKLINIIKALGFKNQEENDLAALIKTYFQKEDLSDRLALDYEHCWTRSKLMSMESPHTVWDESVKELTSLRIRIAKNNLDMKMLREKIDKMIAK